MGREGSREIRKLFSWSRREVMAAYSSVVTVEVIRSDKIIVIL